MAPTAKKKIKREQFKKEEEPPQHPKYPIGTCVRKFFEGHGWFNGQVDSYNADKGGFYNVCYEDDDEEEYTESDLEKIIMVVPEDQKNKKPDTSSAEPDPALSSSSSPDEPPSPAQQPKEEENDPNQPECEFCKVAFTFDDFPSLYPPRDGCYGCEKLACRDCGSFPCCDGTCQTFYCNDCCEELTYHCPCNPDWALCEICVDDYHEGRPQCTEADSCSKYVCSQCVLDKEETHWNKCSNCDRFTCKECAIGEKCWCGKSWFCLDCSDDKESCEVGCQAWMCGKGKCKGKMNRDDEMSCPDCRRRRR